MRLIDAERMPNDEFFDGLSDIEKAKVIQWMISAPTVDAVEVVRCWNCQHYIDGKCYVSNRTNRGLYPRVNIHSRNENDYCSYGERRTEE